jgi:hypothetical protein
MQPTEPLEAVVLEDPPRPPRSTAWKNRAVAIGAFALFVVCSGAGFWAIGRLTNLDLGGTARSGSLIYAWETEDEHAVNVAAAMNAKETGATSAEMRELSRFFDRLLEALQNPDHSEFRDLVDQSAMANRASLHPEVARGSFDRLDMESQLAYDLQGPRDWHRYSIVSVAREKERDELLVYVVFSSDTQTPTPFRWWLRRSGRSWMICDWEMLDLGYSEAAAWALMLSIDENVSNSQYWLANSAIRRASSESEAGNFVAAEVQLREAEKRNLPPLVHDLTQIQIAAAWLECERPDLALAACDRVREPEGQAGVFYNRARAAWDLERQSDFLAANEKYRQLAGAHPELLQLEAEAAESQGKRDQAAECYWQILRLTPDNSDALFDFCRLAGDSGRAEINQVLARHKKPLDRAVEYYTAASRADEIAAAATLLDYVRKRTEPNSPEVEQLLAVQLDNDEQFAEAATHYLAAHKLENHPERKREFFRQYLVSMNAAGRAVEGYQAASDPDAAFKLLTEGYEDDEAYVSDEELPKLVALHRERKPDDAWVAYLDGRLLLKEKKFAEAEKAFVRGQGTAGDAYHSDLLRSGQLEALYRQGDMEAAYAAGSDEPRQSFRVLAGLAVGERNWKRLDELIGLHRFKSPGDRWIDYHTALKEQDAKDYTAALNAVSRAESVDDDGLRSVCSWLKTDLYLASDKLSEALMLGGKPEEAFQRVASRLENEEDWDRLLELTDLHATVAPNKLSSLYYATKARWHKEDYAELTRNLTPWPTDRLKDADQAWITEITDLLVRSWLRQGKIDEARGVADLVRKEHGLELPLVLVELAAGNHEQVRELLATPRLGKDLFQRQLHHDHELAPLLTEPEFAELRRRHALSRPNEYGQRTTTLVVFLKKPVDATRLKKELDGVLGGPGISATARAVASPEGESQRASLIVDLTPETLIITAASASYCQPKEIPEALNDDSPLRAALEQHAAWVAIDLVRPDRPGSSGDAEQLAQRLAAAFCDDSALAIFASNSRRSRQRLVLADAAARDELAAGKLLAPADRALETHAYLYESLERRSEIQKAAWPALRRELRELADAARAENPAGHAMIRVRYTRGHAREDLWLNVIRSRRGEFRSEEFTGELTAASQLWPHLQAGERVRTTFYEPQEVRPIEPAPSSP